MLQAILLNLGGKYIFENTRKKKMAVETDNTKKLIKVCKVCQAYSVYIIFNVSYNQPNNQCKRLLKKFCFYVNGYVLFLLFQFYS